MKRFLIIAVAAAVSFVSVNAQAELIGRLVQVQTDIATFDPGMFDDGPNADVFNLIIENTGDVDATSLQLSLPGPWLNFNPAPLTFRDDAGLPMFGPMTVAESFFVLPSGTEPLAADNTDSGNLLASNFTVAGDTALVPAMGEAVVATLSTLAGGVADLVALQESFSGQGAISGAFSSISFASAVLDPVLGATPVSDPIDLTAVFNAGDSTLADAVALANTGGGDFASLGVIDVDIESESVDGLFSAALNGESIDVTIDSALATTLPVGVQTADLVISSNFGDFRFGITANVPEPGAFGLASLAVIGLAGLRRRV